MATTNYTDDSTVIYSAWLDDVDREAYQYLTSVAGTNTITATGPAGQTAYAAGHAFRFIPANTNTGATTINITPSGGTALGARNIFFNGLACAGSELRANRPCIIIDDGTRFNLIGPESEIPRTAAYQWTDFDPSDVAGAQTNAPATAAATVVAPAYATMANSSGTVTWTFVKAGNYLVTFSMQNEAGASATSLLLRLRTLGGTATRHITLTDAALTNIAAANATGSVSGGISFMVVATVNQTLTILPSVIVTSGGVTTNFTTSAMATVTYVGTV